MTVEALKEELAAFEERKAELLKMHLNQFALIKGRELIGVFPTQEEAYEAGVKRFASKAFLIKRIVEKEEPEQVPLLAYAIRRANI